MRHLDLSANMLIVVYMFGIAMVVWFSSSYRRERGFPGGSVVKNLPAKQEMSVWSLARADPLEKEVTTHSSILAWEIPWTEETDGLQSKGLQRVGHDLANKQQQQHRREKSCIFW